ncbi:hypothetical protein KEM56_007546 [Ascosphaera pollenicola]|nr:hypothetical protein KEM56_007546 [Ascosphaera pollenicola]
MGREDQIEEKETLLSIFPDELTELSEYLYQILVTLDVTNLDEDGDAEPPKLLLQVSYPEAYPDVAPDLDLLTPHNSPKYPHFDIQEDKARLLNALESTIEDNLGMIMIFSVVDTLKESAELLISERQKAVTAEKMMHAEKAEQEENKKFQGTPVTRETFLEWRDQFMKEQQEKEQQEKEEKEAEEKKKRGPREEKKLTGRQLWEKGLAGKVDYDEDFEDSLASRMQKAEITA